MEDSIRLQRTIMRTGGGTLVPGVARSRGAHSAATATTLPLLYLYAVWAVTLFDLHFFLGNLVAAPLGKLGIVIYIPILIIMAVQGPMIVAWAKSWVIYPPFLLLILPATVTLPTAMNVGYARTILQYLLVYYVLALATVVYVRTARQALPIVGMLVGQFVWWAVFARAGGLVPWHPSLRNYDGFGSLMVMGAGICFWFGTAARSKRLKVFFYALAAYSVMAVVISFARGAFLSLVVVVVVIWVRSPKKFVTALGALGAAAVIVGTSAVIFPDGAFWTEIVSSFTEGTTEGTGRVRWSLWGAAFEVFKERPIFGVGAGNFGVFAANFFRSGEIEAFPNPGAFYGLNLHSTYMQILSEFGLVGSIGFIWLLVDFQRRNRALREPRAVERWSAHSGGAFDLRYLALGLEAANLANCLAGLFYASLFSPWFYTVWAANRMLWAVTRPEITSGTAAHPGDTAARTRRRLTPYRVHKNPHR